MELNETERLILQSERMFRSAKSKLGYVNVQLGLRLMPDGTLDKRDKKKGVYKQQYYRMLENIRLRNRERLITIAKKFEQETIDDYEELLHIKQMKYDTYWDMKAAGQHYYADMVLNSIVAIQPYISNQREALALVLENESEAVKKANETPPDSLVPPESKGRRRTVLPGSSGKDSSTKVRAPVHSRS